MSANLVDDILITGNVLVQGDKTSTKYMNAITSTIFSSNVTNVKQISHGDYSTYLCLDNGQVIAAGSNSTGQLGTNDTNARSVYVPILGVSTATQVAGGRAYVFCLLSNGTVVGSGQNIFGLLGVNETATTRSTVVQVLGVSTAVGIGLASHTSYFLLSDGTVACCGLNNSGQLGVNDILTRSTIVKMLGVSTAIKISVGHRNNFVNILLSNGTVVSCGAGTSLGFNDNISHSTVVPMIGISTAVDIGIAGQGTSIVILSDGTVRVVGSNIFGGLGTNSTVDRSTPIPVTGVSTAVSVSTGWFTSYIVLKDGTALGCGQNQYCQLGVTDNVNRSTFIPFPGVSTAVSVANGRYSTMFLLSDGQVAMCGWNSEGRFGINDVFNRSTIIPTFSQSNDKCLFNGFVGLGVVPTIYELDLSTDFARKLTTSTWITGSDERIKTNIESANLDRCAEIIDSLDLKYFEWKSDIQSVDRHALGWIAQDVEKFFPKSVQIDSNGIFMLNSDQLIKVLYGAIKKTQSEYFPRT